MDWQTAAGTVLFLVALVLLVILLRR